LLNVRFRPIPAISGTAALDPLLTLERTLTLVIVSRSIDRIVERIDGGDLRPRAHKVVISLVTHLKLSPLGTEVLEAFTNGRSVGNTELLGRLWSEVERLPLRQQGGGRMLVSLLHPDVDVDWYHAEYLIGWSEDEGISDETILAAFEPD
jgi:hypothetical protein